MSVVLVAHALACGPAKEPPVTPAAQPDTAAEMRSNTLALKPATRGPGVLPPIVDGYRITPAAAITFYPNSARLQSERTSALEGLAAIVLANPEIEQLVVVVEDGALFANASYQVFLSQKRAESIASWLGHHGVPTEVLRSRGLGDACAAGLSPSLPEAPHIELVVLRTSGNWTGATCGCPGAMSRGLECP
jgi:outer membrane protein OmpA-like peptidoglycan-associated protein